MLIYEVGNWFKLDDKLNEFMNPYLKDLDILSQWRNNQKCATSFNKRQRMNG